MEDEQYSELFNYHVNKNRPYPEEIYSLPYIERSNAKSKFRKRAKIFTVLNDQLMYNDLKVAKKSELGRIFEAFHDNPTSGGHFGRDKTLSKIRQEWYWKGIKGDILKYVNKCEKCFETNPKLHEDAPPLNPIPVPERVWSLVGIDIVGPLHETKNGNKYICAITDHFSKFSQAAPLPDKSANSVALFLYSVICRFGCFESMISDQGRKFVNELNDKLMEYFQSDHRISSSYHPQTNGQRERDNRTLKNALSKLVNEHGDDWDDYIDGVLLAYHSSEHASTKNMPFEVMFGRKPRLPVKIRNDDASNNNSFDGSNEANNGAVETLMQLRDEINKAVSENIERAQARQKKNYDKKHCKNDKKINIGSEVYIKNRRQINRKGGKMEARWLGPYIVEKVLTKGRYKLKNPSSGAI